RDEPETSATDKRVRGGRFRLVPHFGAVGAVTTESQRAQSIAARHGGVEEKAEGQAPESRERESRGRESRSLPAFFSALLDTECREAMLSATLWRDVSSHFGTENDTGCASGLPSRAMGGGDENAGDAVGGEMGADATGGNSAGGDADGAQIGDIAVAD